MSSFFSKVQIGCLNVSGCTLSTPSLIFYCTGSWSYKWCLHFKCTDYASVSTLSPPPNPWYATWSDVFSKVKIFCLKISHNHITKPPMCCPANAQLLSIVKENWNLTILPHKPLGRHRAVLPTTMWLVKSLANTWRSLSNNKLEHCY